MKADQRMSERDWQLVAEEYAEQASELWSDYGWGVLYVDDVDACVLFNNRRCVGDPAARDQELADIRAGLEKLGIRELAYATYSEDGDTYALVIDAGPDREQAIDRLFQDATRRTVRQPVGKGHE